jgi:hypothetical protein
LGCWDVPPDTLMSLPPPVQAEFLLAPVYAANIALAATIRRYDKAQHRLERLLCDRQIVGISKVCKLLEGTLMPYSELLWSQLIQLQAALSQRLQASSITVMTNDSLPTEQQVVSQAIEGSLTSLEVFPCHVVLRNDKTLLKIMNSQTSEVETLTESLLNLHPRKWCHPAIISIYRSLDKRWSYARVRTFIQSPLHDPSKRLAGRPLD